MIEKLREAAEEHGANAFPTWGQLLQLLAQIITLHEAERAQEAAGATAAAAATARSAGDQPRSSELDHAVVPGLQGSGQPGV